MERQVLEISDREQRRIGQDLHDGLGQQLAGIGFLSKSLEQRLTKEKSAEAGDATGDRKFGFGRDCSGSRNGARAASGRYVRHGFGVGIEGVGANDPSYISNRMFIHLRPAGALSRMERLPLISIA